MHASYDKTLFRLYLLAYPEIRRTSWIKFLLYNIAIALALDIKNELWWMARWRATLVLRHWFLFV